jgi:hypothetical protein
LTIPEDREPVLHKGVILKYFIPKAIVLRLSNKDKRIIWDYAVLNAKPTGYWKNKFPYINITTSFQFYTTLTGILAKYYFFEKNNNLKKLLNQDKRAS